ncbi:4Fe-4S binding protein [bacterium]|nr:4Fe-4S binding protein [bacterium]
MDNNSQEIHIKKEVLIQLIKAFFSDDFEENTRLVPYDIRPTGADVPYRCCIYKERAIIKDRTIAGLGFQIEEDDERCSLTTYARKAMERTSLDGKNLTVLQAACKGCVPSQIHVTDLCQACVARPCQSACKFGAVSVENGRSQIDSKKCKKCKMCISACPYNAIVKITVPCEEACPVGAIAKDDSGFACIDFEKCISCGRCIAACPFGAVHEKSQIIDILKAMVSDKKVIAMIAPSIAGQFPGNIYQLKTAMLKAGFDDVYEVAQGADITARNEAMEFVERMKDINEKNSDWLTEWANEGGYGEIEESGEEENFHKFMTTSCCAGYNQLVKKHLQEIKPYVSDTKTPLYYTAELVKQKEPDAITVFVSPCVAKRAEGFDNENVNFVMSFEELGALFVAKKIEILNCEETYFEKESSKQARNFGVTGGVAEAVKKSLKDEESVKSYVISGLNKENIKILKKFASCGECEGGCNLVEVMCCEGGCIAGNSTINNPRIAKKLINNILTKSEDIEKTDLP